MMEGKVSMKERSMNRRKQSKSEDELAKDKYNVNKEIEAKKT